MIEFTCLFTGVAFALAAWALISVAFAERGKYDQAHQFEQKRRDSVRLGSFTFRHFEPAIDELARVFANGNQQQAKKLEENLSTSGIPEPWTAHEFMATKAIESFMIAIGAFVFLILILGYGLLSSILLTMVIAAVMYWLAFAGVEKKSKKRRHHIKRNFAAAIDLLALMMEVGGGFLDSLKVVAKEYHGKPLGNELSAIISDVELGKPRKQALNSFERRMKDDDISEVVFACNESEELGVPIAKTLRDQADRIRQKRSSWAEKAAQEAEVTLTFPAMIIMIACMITVGAPFVLSFLQNASFEF